MQVQIRTPSITGASDREKLQQIQSYLYQMARQLQWAFDNLSREEASAVRNSAVTGGGKQRQDTQQQDFSGLKELIIKSADIVNAYYAQISRRLEGVYLAQSEFGTYSRETALEIQANSDSIRQLFTDTESLSQTVNEIRSTTLVTNAYLKTGMLYEDKEGMGVYGLEIGQTRNLDGEQIFDKFARFTADRLSFFDSNDVEVAYISDYHLHITKAVVTGALVLMQQFEVSQGNRSLDFKWIGG